MKYIFYHERHNVSIKDLKKRTYYHFLSPYSVTKIEIELKDKSLIQIINSDRHLSSLKDIFDILVKDKYEKIIAQIVKEYKIPYIHVHNIEEDILPF